MMVAQNEAYAAQDFSGSRPRADSVDQQISHGGLIAAPQFLHDNPKVRPPRFQFGIRHEWLRLAFALSGAS